MNLGIRMPGAAAPWTDRPADRRKRWLAAPVTLITLIAVFSLGVVAPAATAAEPSTDAVYTFNFNTADELRRIIAEGRMSDEALQAITGIASDALTSFLRATPSREPGLSTSSAMLSPAEEARLSGLAAQLTEGFQIDDDVRLRAILETLTVQCHLTHQNIALLTQIGLDDLEKFLGDPKTVPLEKKYELAVRASYLIHAVANAAPDPAQF
jgi:hypothetical protein